MADRDKVEQWMKADFLPAGTQPASEHKISNALEYMAYHLGQIDKKLDQVIAALAARQG